MAAQSIFDVTPCNVTVFESNASQWDTSHALGAMSLGDGAGFTDLQGRLVSLGIDENGVITLERDSIWDDSNDEYAITCEPVTQPASTSTVWIENTGAAFKQVGLQYNPAVSWSPDALDDPYASGSAQPDGTTDLDPTEHVAVSALTSVTYCMTASMPWAA